MLFSVESEVLLSDRASLKKPSSLIEKRSVLVGTSCIQNHVHSWGTNRELTRGQLLLQLGTVSCFSKSLPSSPSMISFQVCLIGQGRLFSSRPLVVFVYRWMAVSHPSAERVREVQQRQLWFHGGESVVNRVLLSTMDRVIYFCCHICLKTQQRHIDLPALSRATILQHGWSRSQNKQVEQFDSNFTNTKGRPHNASRAQNTQVQHFNLEVFCNDTGHRQSE